MRIAEFNEIIELAYDVRTDEQRRQGTFDWWYNGQNASQYKFEKKPLQRAYCLFTKKGTFMRDRAYTGRDDMRHAAEAIEGFLDGNPSEHDYNAALAGLNAADQGAKDAARAYRQIQERMVYPPAWVLDIRPLSFRLETIFEPIISDFADREYSNEAALELQEAFNNVYDRDANSKGAWQTEDDMFVLARRLHNGHKWPLYFLDAEHEEKYLDEWSAWDLRETFINHVDRLHTLADRALALCQAATDGGKWERAKREIETVLDLLDSDKMYYAVKTLAERCVSTSSDKRNRLNAAWDQMIQSRWHWRNTLNAAATQKHEPNGKDNLVGYCQVAVEYLHLVRSARYKVHVVGRVPFLKSWIRNHA